jgi:hypothetical protein
MTKKKHSQDFLFIDYLKMNFADREVFDLLSNKIVNWFKKELDPEDPKFKIVEWVSPLRSVSHYEADSSLVVATLKGHLQKLGVKYLTYLQEVFRIFIKYYLFEKPFGSEKQTKGIHVSRELVLKNLEDMSERIVFDYSDRRFKRIIRTQLLAHSFIRPDYDKNQILWALKTIMSYDLARFCLDEELLRRLHQCHFCGNYYVASTIRTTKFCSDKCRLGHHNQERVRSGQHAEYMRVARKRGKKGPRGGLYH